MYSRALNIHDIIYVSLVAEALKCFEYHIHPD